MFIEDVHTDKHTVRHISYRWKTFKTSKYYRQSIQNLFYERIHNRRPAHKLQSPISRIIKTTRKILQLVFINIVYIILYWIR